MMQRVLATAACAFALTLVIPAWATEDDASAADKEAETSTSTPTPPRATGEKSKPGVLDFEAELIEGERKSPDLFLQLQSGTPNLDAILFQRTNFNDFHNVEKHRRPLYRRYVK
jgi:hypothetical protein